MQSTRQWHPYPISLTRAATRYTSQSCANLGRRVPAQCRKAEPCCATTGRNIDWIDLLVTGPGVDRWHYPFPERPVPFTRLDDDHVSGVLGWAQQPPGGLRGQRCYILWGTVSKRTRMRQVLAPDLPGAKTKEKQHGPK